MAAGCVEDGLVADCGDHVASGVAFHSDSEYAHG